PRHRKAFNTEEERRTSRATEKERALRAQRISASSVALGVLRSSSVLNPSYAPALLLGQHVAQASQGQGVAGDAEAGEHALANRSGVRQRAAADRVGDMQFDGRELHLADRGDQRRIATREP